MNPDRPRATVFGEVAETYDRARPSYPGTLIDDLLKSGGRRVLDVGCGTGKAGRLFAERSCRVLGIEPDERMAAIARRHGLEVEIDRFETWEPGARRFDLVVSGQAWHWVDPVLGAGKAAEVLADEGHLAVFWNGGRPDAERRERLDEVYGTIAPELLEGSTAFGRGGGDRENGRVIDALHQSGHFERAETRAYPWTRTYTVGSYVERLLTHSTHILLDAGRREALVAAIRDALGPPDEPFVVEYTTTLIRAKVRPRTR